MCNKRIKTAAICVFASMLIQQTCQSAHKLEYDYDNGRIIVSGQAEDKKRVSIQVVNPGADLTDGDTDAYDGYFTYVGYADCDESGGYTLNIGLDSPGADETAYRLRVNGEEYEKDFSFTKSSKVNDVLTAVNNARDVQALAENLKEYSRLLGISTYVLFDNITDADKLQLAQKLISGTDVNCSQFAAEVNGVVLPAALRSASDENFFAAVLNDYASLLPIDYEIQYYKTLGDAQKQKITDRMYAEKTGAVSLDAVKRIYEEAVVLEAIANVGQKSQVGDIIDYFRHLLAQYNAYAALGDKKTAVWEKAIDADKSSFAVFESQFNSWIAGGTTVNPAPNPGGNGGGTGGSWKGGETGSSSGGVFMKPEVKQPFGDISSAAWASESITELYERKIVSGTGEGKFSPQNSVKREEFVQMISLALGLDTSAVNNGFADAENGAWYTPCINAAADAGIISGISENIFGVGMNISRQDMAVIASKCLEYAQYSMPDSKSAEFADAEDISDYAKTAVAELTASGVLNGFEDSTFRPKENVSRAQAAVVVYRLILLMEGKRW